MGQFGNKFRQAREKKNLSLDDVSNVTKISSRMLKAIEEEHFDQLPGGVFNKGFVRAYAKHLGLNDEEAVADYLVCLREAQIDAHEVWDPVRPELSRAAAPNQLRVADSRKPPAKTQPPVQVEELPELQLPRVQDIRPAPKKFAGKRESGIPWSIVVVAAVVIVLATFLWIRHSRPTRAAAPSAAPLTVSNTAGLAPSATPSAVSTTSASVASQQPIAPAPEQPSSKPAPKPAQSSPASQNSGVATKDTSDVTIRSFAPSNTKPAAKPALTLVIRATETSWISVQADGQLVSQETLIAPAATSFHATRELVVRVGNAAGVSFLWNGEELPAQGAESEAKTFVFDAQGMRAPASDQTPH
ncbi:MAG TPA: RodZ domain-containing protein [Candidatus Sulfotelmatobacter sp.]|nr:RodZ domain-containing protein [Candidatus Sulfotelmatobacter sp.]